jgi:hypothetical protein
MISAHQIYRYFLRPEDEHNDRTFLTVFAGAALFMFWLGLLIAANRHFGEFTVAG